MRLPEPIGYEYRWTNPANDRVPESSTAWKPVELKRCETIPEEAALLERYRYDDKPTYEVRKLYSETQLKAEIERRDAVLRMALEAFSEVAAWESSGDPFHPASKAIKAFRRFWDELTHIR